MTDAQPTPWDAEADRKAFLDSIQSAKFFADVQSLGPFPYQFATLFPRTTGFGSTGEVRQRVRMLKAAEPRLHHLLYPGERIEFVTSGMFNSFVEQYFLGWMAYMINRRIFLFTNYRVILLDAKGTKAVKEQQWQIPYDGITNFTGGGFLSGGNIVFKLTNGKSYKFAGVPSRDRKSLGDYVTGQVGRVNQEAFRFPQHTPYDPLCPACSSPAAKHAEACETCGEAIINAKTPALLSLLLPGLGDFYLGHYTLGFMSLLSHGILAFIALLQIMEDAAILPIWLLVLGVNHAFNGAMTLHLAKKGVILKRSVWR